MTRTQLAGSIGMFGGACYLIGGLRMLAHGAGEDRLTDIFGMLWALAWVVAAWDMRRTRVTGASWFGRASASLLVAGFAAAFLWGAHRFIDLGGANRGPFAIAPLLVILGMFGTGVAVLRAPCWPGLRRFLPLAIAATCIGTIIGAEVSGQSTLEYAFTLAGAGYVGLGATLPERS